MKMTDTFCAVPLSACWRHSWNMASDVCNSFSPERPLISSCIRSMVGQILRYASRKPLYHLLLLLNSRIHTHAVLMILNFEMQATIVPFVKNPFSAVYQNTEW